MDGELVQSFWNFDYFENKENVFQRKNLVTLFHPWHNTGLQKPTSKQHIFSTSQKWSQKREKSWLKLDPPPPHCPECAAALQTPQSSAIEVARSQILQFRIFNERLRDRERSGDVGRCADRQQRRAPVGGVGVGGRTPEHRSWAEGWVEIWWVEQPPGQEVTQTRSPGQHQQSWKICLEF